MLLNYLKLSLRLLVRNPFFTFINVLGLAVGFSVFIFLWQYSQNELQSDRKWKDWRRIARVGFHVTSSEGEAIFGIFPAGISAKMKQDFPEIEELTRLSQFLGSMLLSTVQKQQRVIFKEEKIVFADANFFQFFDMPFIYGQAEKSLADGNSVSISHSTAVKYFGERNPLGEILILNDTMPLHVAGVFVDLPANSHLDFDIVISNEPRLGEWAEVRIVPMVQSYIKTRTILDWYGFEAKLNGSNEKYWHEIMKGFPRSQLKRMLLQPLPEVAFISAIDSIDPSAQKSRSMLIIFGAIGLVVLISAWINYIILSLSRVNKRMKEVATRKVSGASFKDFARQFIIEALMLNAVSIALGFTLLQFVRRSGNLLFDIPLYDFSETDGWNILILLSIFLVGIITTGLYPALVAARYHPRALFSMYASAGFSKSGRMISLLTTAQYASAIILILCAFIVYLQLDHVITKSLDDVGDSIVVIDAPLIRSGTYLADLENFAGQLGAITGVTGKTLSCEVMGDNGDADVTVYRTGSDLNYMLDSSGGVDENFIPFFNIKILAGRNFVATDRGNAIILSEQAIKRLGFTTPSDAIGAKIKVEKSESLKSHNLVDMEIIGVIKDYRLRPYFIDESIAEIDRGIGLVFKGYLTDGVSPQRVIIKVEPRNVQTVLLKAKEHFQAVFPGEFFNWYWLDEHMARNYNHEKTNRNQISVFTCIAIGIACLGLLGIISNKVMEKTKEIGIRKILGAELHQIAQLLLNTTVNQITVATLIGIPVAYYLAQQYLERYSERIVLEWWHFALPVLILVLIMLVTIASVLWKAAKSNPVDALKYE